MNQRVDGDRIQKVFAGRAEASGVSIEEVKKEALALAPFRPLGDFSYTPY